MPLWVTNAVFRLHTSWCHFALGSRRPECSQCSSLPRTVHSYVVELVEDVTRVVQRKNVGMLEPGEKADLAEKARFGKVGGWIEGEDLDRDLPLVPQIAREIDRGERALPQLALDLVAALEGRPKKGEGNRSLDSSRG